MKRETNHIHDIENLIKGFDDCLQAIRLKLNQANQVCQSVSPVALQENEPTTASSLASVA